MMFSIQFFKIYGLVAGVQYVDGRIEAFELDEDQRCLQFFLFLVGFQITWYVTPQD